MITDPISDLITRLRNARVGEAEVEVNNTKKTRAILKLLFAEGWISGWVIRDGTRARSRDLACVKAQVDSRVTKSLFSSKKGGTLAPERLCRSEAPGSLASLQKTSASLVVLMKDKAIDGSYGYGKSGGGRKSYESSSIYGKLIFDIHRVSKPSKRVYLKLRELPADSLTTYVLSTNKGILTSVEARQLKVGGEVLFYLTT